jgi:hypothetical protein
MSQLNYVWEGIGNAPQPPASPALGLDYVDSIFYVSSKPSSTAPSVWVPIGGGGNLPVVPVITASVQAVNTTVTQGVSITAPGGVPTMYAVSIYMKSFGAAASGHVYTETLTYTSADGGGTQTVELILPLDSASVLMETYPLLILAGSTLVASGAYGGGATNDPYTISMRIVSMPLAS